MDWLERADQRGERDVTVEVVEGDAGLDQAAAARAAERAAQEAALAPEVRMRVEAFRQQLGGVVVKQFRLPGAPDGECLSCGGPATLAYNTRCSLCAEAARFVLTL